MRLKNQESLPTTNDTTPCLDALDVLRGAVATAQPPIFLRSEK